MSEKKEVPAKTPSAPPQTPPPEPPKWLITLKKIISAILTIIVSIFKNPFVIKIKSTITKLGALGWLKIFTCLSLAALTFVIYKTAPHWKKFWKLPYVTTFTDVADSKVLYPADVEVIRYNNDLLAPQFIVQISKIVVNIRPSKQSTQNPMIAFDLYVRTDNEEASIEVRKREKELQDHLQRFCEGLTYDQILTEEGKHIWKQKMKRELNLVLSTGRIKDIYFKTLLLKP